MEGVEEESEERIQMECRLWKEEYKSQFSSFHEREGDHNSNMTRK